MLMIMMIMMMTLDNWSVAPSSLVEFQLWYNFSLSILFCYISIQIIHKYLYLCVYDQLKLFYDLLKLFLGDDADKDVHSDGV